ncbi:MAG TPA: hypothetical protein VLJ42_05185 [Solirubrobacteraceae bacterium]|nr:hypothetical protein [Solirubrobacteraceae bacterium]
MAGSSQAPSSNLLHPGEHKAIRRGVFHSAPELITAISDYLDATNPDPQPFTWTASADHFLEKIHRGRITLDTINNQN